MFEVASGAFVKVLSGLPDVALICGMAVSPGGEVYLCDSNAKHSCVYVLT